MCKLTSQLFALREQMRSKFFRNLASFDSIDKMRLPRLSDSRKIYHIYPPLSTQFVQRYPTRSSPPSWFSVWNPDLSGRAICSQRRLIFFCPSTLCTVIWTATPSKQNWGISKAVTSTDSKKQRDPSLAGKKLRVNSLWTSSTFH